MSYGIKKIKIPEVFQQNNNTTSNQNEKPLKSVKEIISESKRHSRNSSTEFVFQEMKKLNSGGENLLEQLLNKDAKNSQSNVIENPVKVNDLEIHKTPELIQIQTPKIETFIEFGDKTLTNKIDNDSLNIESLNNTFYNESVEKIKSYFTFNPSEDEKENENMENNDEKKGENTESNILNNTKTEEEMSNRYRENYDMVLTELRRKSKSVKVRKPGIQSSEEIALKIFSFFLDIQGFAMQTPTIRKNFYTLLWELEALVKSIKSGDRISVDQRINNHDEEIEYLNKYFNILKHMVDNCNAKLDFEKQNSGLEEMINSKFLELKNEVDKMTERLVNLEKKPLPLPTSFNPDLNNPPLFPNNFNNNFNPIVNNTPLNFNNNNDFLNNNPLPNIIPPTIKNETPHVINQQFPVENPINKQTFTVPDKSGNCPPITVMSQNNINLETKTIEDKFEKFKELIQKEVKEQIEKLVLHNDDLELRIDELETKNTELESKLDSCINFINGVSEDLGEFKEKVVKDNKINMNNTLNFNELELKVNQCFDFKKLIENRQKDAEEVLITRQDRVESRFEELFEQQKILVSDYNEVIAYQDNLIAMIKEIKEQNKTQQELLTNSLNYIHQRQNDFDEKYQNISSDVKVNKSVLETLDKQQKRISTSVEELNQISKNYIDKLENVNKDKDELMKTLSQNKQEVENIRNSIKRLSTTNEKELKELQTKLDDVIDESNVQKKFRQSISINSNSDLSAFKSKLNQTEEDLSKVFKIITEKDCVYDGISKPLNGIKKIIVKEDYDILTPGYFKNCESLEEIIFESNHIQSIPQNFCFNCKNLKKVVLSESITIIESKAFANCVNLEEIDLKNVNIIENEAFINCGFKQVDLQKINSLGISSFKDNTFLHNVKFSDNLKIIPKACFENCQSLVNILIPKSITFISERAFINTKISSVTVYKTTIQNRAFNPNIIITKIK